MKRCPRCKTEKSAGEFHKSSRNGLQVYCKVCSRELDHLKYLDNKDRILAHNRAYSHANLDKIRVWAKEYRARTRGNKALAVERRRANKVGLPASLTTEEWGRTLAVFGKRCAYCDSTGVLQQDHFIPAASGGGYEAGNIIPACPSCNKKKWQHSPLEFLGIRKYAEVMTRIHGG